MVLYINQTGKLSVSQQNLAVTTIYPEIVAEMYPYFDNEHLSDFVKNNLWFL